jgi:hypothetical protein
VGWVTCVGWPGWLAWVGCVDGGAAPGAAVVAVVDGVAVLVGVAVCGAGAVLAAPPGSAPAGGCFAAATDGSGFGLDFIAKMVPTSAAAATNPMPTKSGVRFFGISPVCVVPARVGPVDVRGPLSCAPVVPCGPVVP